MFTFPYTAHVTPFDTFMHGQFHLESFIWEDCWLITASHLCISLQTWSSFHFWQVGSIRNKGRQQEKEQAMGDSEQLPKTKVFCFWKILLSLTKPIARSLRGTQKRTWSLYAVEKKKHEQYYFVLKLKKRPLTWKEFSF